MPRKGLAQLPNFTPHETAPPENPDLIEQLSFEHTQIRRMWADLQLAHRRHVEDVHRPDARMGIVGQRELGRRIVQAVAEHDAVEAELLYPKAADVIGEEWVEHARADDAEVRDLLDEVDGENPEDEGVYEIFNEVLERLLRHFDEEESIVFPMLRVVVDDSELAAARRAAWLDPPPQHPDTIDLAAAEREAAAAPAQNRRARRLLRRS